MTNIEKRLHNTERALMLLAGLIADRDTELKEEIDSIMSEYVNANKSIGSVRSKSEFLTHEEASWVSN